MAAVQTVAQERKVQNKPYIDLRPMHFGIHVGLNLQDIEFVNLGPQTVTLEDGTVMQQTVSQTVTMAKTVWQSLIMLVQGRFSFNDLSGPVGITKAVSVVASEGLKINFMSAVNNIIFIMALITINLGVVNLLPFPALDGGRFVFLLIEAIIRRPLPRKLEYIVNGVGLVILLLFIAVISVKDVWQLITGTFPGM